MDLLPVEILYIIVGHLSKQDLSTARLICKAIDACTVRALFCNVTVWIQKQSLERLLRISQCKHISKYVQKLTFGFELLQTQLPSRDRYLRWLCEQQGCNLALPILRHLGQPLTFANIGMCTGRRNWTPERVSAAYEAYKRRVDEQKCLETIGMDVITLTAAFANLPNLRSVIIKSDYYRQLDVAELPKDISTIQREILLSPYHTQTLRSRDTGRLHLQHLIRAAGVTGAQITDLTILDSENAMAQAVLRLHPADLFTARRAFQHVRRFHFKLPEYTNKGSQVAIFAEGQLGELIQSMPELEELTLVASSCSPNVPWSTICGTKQLASLCSLDLQRFNFHEDEFLDFLTRHAGSLKAVSLFYVEMYSGTFMSLFHRMRDALRLDRLELDGIFKDVGGDYLDYSFWAARAIERFVTRHSLNYPSEEIFQHQRGESPD